MSNTEVTLGEVAALPSFRDIRELGLHGLGIEDISALSDLNHVQDLYLSRNAIEDVLPLAALSGLRSLSLAENRISDIGPLVSRTIWDSRRSVNLWLEGNPLDQTSIDEHIPTLESWGLQVYFHRDELEERVAIPDPALRSLVARDVAANTVLVDDPVTRRSIRNLRSLYASGSGVSDLSGLESATNLYRLYVGGNRISDLTQLENLAKLSRMDLSDNLITDISPLVRNRGLGEDDWVTLEANPLSEESLNVHVPALLGRGVQVDLESVLLGAAADGDAVGMDTKGYFAALLGDGIRFAASVSDRGLATAEVVDGTVSVRPRHLGGTVRVTVAATDETGRRAALTFVVKVDGALGVALLPSASDPVRQGFVRVINASGEAGEVRIDAIDDAGKARGPVILAIGAGTAAHFNSDDLEAGNTAKGLSGGTGRGNGDWRLRLDSDLDIAVLSYIRTGDGFLTAMNDLAPLTESGHHVATFNPGSNWRQESLLRLANPGDEDAEVTITGIDSDGRSPGGGVSLSVRAGAALTLTAQDLETGSGLAGALGNGVGKWRLEVVADGPMEVASLLRSPTGHLTNLSSVPDNRTMGDAGETTHHVPLFLSAADPQGRLGFVRVINRGAANASVRVQAFDDSHHEYDAVSLSVPAGAAAHFNSDDLELGNPAKGLSAGVGSGVGDWRLELTSEADVEVLAYVRTPDGFLTSMHDVVHPAPGGHRVPTFNPGNNVGRQSLLRIVNSGTMEATVVINGTDDLGRVRGNGVRLSVGAGQTRTVSAQELELGSADLEGQLGEGIGKWRLVVRSDQPIQVMNLLNSAAGHLTNLSTGSGS